MKTSTLIARNIVFHRALHLTVLLGVAMGTGVLTGALASGDSVRNSLRRLVLRRLGAVELALSSGERLFRQDLARATALELRAPVAPVLRVAGSAARADGAQHCGGVQVLGVDERFWAFGSAGTSSPQANLAPGEALVGERLAARLKLRTGDTIVARVGRISQLPGGAALASDTDRVVPLRFRVKGIAGDENMGRFSLKPEIAAPLNVFANLEDVAERMGRKGCANMLLVARKPDGGPSPAEATAALRKCWTLEDAGLRLRSLPGNAQVELLSERVFIEPPVARAALSAVPGARGILTYFVTRIDAGGRTTPYSFVSAPGAPLVSEGMSDNAVVINEWLSLNLDVEAGDSIKLSYLVPAPGTRLEEKSRSFFVTSVVAIAGVAADPTLTPDFPGLTDAEDCAKWDAGMPLDLGALRPEDTLYWEKNRGTPKAFVTLTAAVEMWGSRFGSLTSVRYDVPEQAMSDVQARVLARLDPAAVGLLFQPVRAEGLGAAAGGVDFGLLVTGLSFFVVVAAFMLTGLLFVLGLDHRSEELGTLLALGFTPARLSRLLLVESAVVAVPGCVAGVLFGLLYNLAMLQWLGALWGHGAGALSLSAHVEPRTLVLGAVFGLGAALVASRIGVGTLTFLHTPSQLQRRLTGGPTAGRGDATLSLGVAALAMVVAAGLSLFAQRAGGAAAAGIFFAAGGLLLAALLGVCDAALRSLDGTPLSGSGGAPAALWLRNCARKRGRSLLAVGILAAGVFVVVAVGLNSPDPLRGAGSRQSGTGGFALVGETAVPVGRDLNTARERLRIGMAGRFADARFVQFRASEGEDASCLNLNRAHAPRLLAVDPQELACRDAFKFAALSPGVDAASPWLSLNADLGSNTVAGIADLSVIKWGLGLAPGDTLSYVDEAGRTFKVKLVAGLANSVFQGSVLVSSKAFVDHFPSDGGCRFFLVDAPPEMAASLSQTLSNNMQDMGLRIVTAKERLAAFNAVESTYRAVFMALGGIGLLLGTVGLAILVFRGALERRGEFALLRAVGFTRLSVALLLMREHWFLLTLGLVCGTVAGCVAGAPAVAAGGVGTAAARLAATLLAIAASGTVWTAAAALAATRGHMAAALRNE